MTSSPSFECLERLARCKHHLHVLKSSTAAVQKVLLQKGDRDLITSLSEICSHILTVSLKLTPQSRESLRRFKTILRKVAAQPKISRRCRSADGDSNSISAPRNQCGGGSYNSKRGCGGGGGVGTKRHDTSSEGAWKKKRRYLVQVGCGPFLTSLLTSALGAIVGKLINRFLVPQSK